MLPLTKRRALAAVFVVMSALVLPSEALAEGLAGCSPMPIPLPALTSAEVNDFAHQIWSVEDETVFKPSASNIAAGVVLGGAGFFDGSHQWHTRLLTGPAFFYRINLNSKAAGVPAQALARGELKLNQLIDYESGDIERRLGKELDLVQLELSHIDAVESSLKAEPATPTLERQQYIDKVKTDMVAQRKEQEKRHDALCDANLQRLAWDRRARAVLDAVHGLGHGGFTGLEFMFGYGFDVANPTTNRIYSGAIGGIGAAFLAWHLGFGVGFMAQQDGLFGLYLSLSAPIL